MSSPKACPRRSRRPDPVLLEGLRKVIKKLEGHGVSRCSRLFTLGAPEVDAALPRGGLPGAALHQIVDGDAGGNGAGTGSKSAAALGFCAALLARLGTNGGNRGTVLWCRRGRGLYGPGLPALDLDPARLIVVCGGNRTDILWAMEESLRSGAPAAVLGEVEGASPTALRRLQLAAETGGVPALLLTAAHPRAVSGPAASRWRVSAAPSSEGARPRWRVELMRCRNGASGLWLMEWRHATADEPTGSFAVAADLPHRSSGKEAAEGSRRRRAV